MTPLLASAAVVGTTYISQRGTKVTVVGSNALGVQVKDGLGRVSTLERDHQLLPVEPVDADAPLLDLANVIGKPRAIIETVLCDLTEVQLDDLLEADTRAFVEHLVGKERERRGAPKPAPTDVEIVNAVAAPGNARAKVIQDAALATGSSLVDFAARAQEAGVSQYDLARSLPDGTRATPDGMPGNVTQFPRPAPAPAITIVGQSDIEVEEMDLVAPAVVPLEPVAVVVEHLVEREPAALPPAAVTLQNDVSTADWLDGAPSPEVTNALTAEPAATPDTEPPAPPVEPEATRKTFPRATCPVCGHEGMLTASGKVRAHQHKGAPCQGQQALDVPPAPVTVAPVVPARCEGEHRYPAGATTCECGETYRLGEPPHTLVPSGETTTTRFDGNGDPVTPPDASDYAEPTPGESPDWNAWGSPLAIMEGMESEIRYRSLGNVARIIDGLDHCARILTNQRLNDALAMLEEHGDQADIDKVLVALGAAIKQERGEPTPAPTRPAPTPTPMPTSVALSTAGVDRVRALQKHLAALSDAIPGYVSAQEAVRALRALGVSVDLDTVGGGE